MDVSQSLSKRCQALLEDIARQEGFIKYKLTVTKGLAPGENFLSDIYRAIIQDCENEERSLHLIVKVSIKLPEHVDSDFIINAYKRETYVYSEMLPILDECQKDLPADERFAFAKLYRAVLEDEEMILVMEDLCKKGYRMLDRMIPFDYEHLVVCIKTIARFHATSFVLRAKKPEIYEEIFSITNNHQKTKISFGDFVASNKGLMKHLIKNEPYESAMDKVLDNINKEFNRTFGMDETSKYGVLIHGDSWSNNLLFREKNGKPEKMVVVDWQLMRNASPIIDLSYVLLMTTDSQMRSKHYEELLDLYYEVLSYNVSKMGVDITKCYPVSVYRQQIGQYMIFGLFIAMCLLPVSLANREDVVEINEFYEGLDDENKRSPMSETCCRRLKEIFVDCVKYNII